jgi:hypothetical protein
MVMPNLFRMIPVRLYRGATLANRKAKDHRHLKLFIRHRLHRGFGWSGQGFDPLVRYSVRRYGADDCGGGSICHGRVQTDDTGASTGRIEFPSHGWNKVAAGQSIVRKADCQTARRTRSN